MQKLSKHLCTALLSIPMLVASAGSAQAADWTVLQDESVFAIVTHKAGLGAKLAHNHLIAGRGYDARLSFDADSPGDSTFMLSAPVDQLAVDNAQLQSTWFPRLQELGILDEAFGDLSDKDRGKIRQAMMSDDQLDAEQHGTLTAKVVGIDTSDDSEFPWRINLAMTVAGKTVTKAIKGRYTLEGDQLSVEAYGEFAFTDFGIEPYSAMLGAVRNEDGFHLFLHLAAER